MIAMVAADRQLWLGKHYYIINILLKTQTKYNSKARNLTHLKKGKPET